MKKLITLLIYIFSFGSSINAQKKIISSGLIEFERKINLYRLYENNPEITTILKKDNQQFRKDIFILSFNETKSIYKSGKDNSENYKFQKIPAENNIVYRELNERTSVSQKEILDNTFLIPDTIKTIQWKITNEKRQIAGFECRRANAIILDSIYIVAFFTEEIITSGGPESFSGLPGMILGIAIPQQHVTWFANKLSLPVLNEVIEKPKIGKSISNLELKDFIENKFNVYGDLRKWYSVFSLL